MWTLREQFSLSLEKALPFPLNPTHLIRTPLMQTTDTCFLTNQQILTESQPH